ncbi:DNA polymerase III subunit delta [Tunturibacter empetritectus]|uniref:DNA polymerase III subunit delta n=1 Tax=Tunturiibacter lichenicola TaxID=2051959 RepID=A0A7W8J530_9BACT|nr:DNA polymerase III subunit delta [Edaphobacter lichenicola]MBB5342757.1 DNA polymerase-3 subunit delta [Edaphobacter lichenicola]
MASLKSFASVDRFVTEIASPATLRPAYVLVGDEVFLYDRCRKAVLATLAPEDTRDFCLHDLDLAETGIFEVLDRAQTPSLMAPFQVLFVRNLKTLYGRASKKEEFAAIDAYFRSPNPQALLLFVADHLRIPTDLRKMDYQDKERFEKIRETLGDWCGTVELARVDENDAIKWVTTTAESRNIKFDPDAARELVDSLGADMMLIASEFEKLLLYVSAPTAQPREGVLPTAEAGAPSFAPLAKGGVSSEARPFSSSAPQSQDVISTGGIALAAAAEQPAFLPTPSAQPLTKNRVTLGDVETMVLAAKQRSLYELTDAISAKDRPRALLLLHGLLNASDGGEDAAIGHLYMLARTFRQMLIISEKNVRDSRAIWQALWQGFRMPPFAAEDLIKQARRYKSRRELTRAIRLVARADLELRSSPANKLLVLERLILDLSTEPKPTPYDPTHQFAMEL